MIIDILYVSSLVLAGYSLRILTEGLVPDIKETWRTRRQDREDDEVLRIVSGLSGDPEPEVDVASEKIKSTLRERLEDWWIKLWTDSTPRSPELAIQGFTSIRQQVLWSTADKPKRYQGRHRADKTLKQEGDDVLPISEEEVPRRDRGQDSPGEGSSDERIIDEG